MGIRAPWRSVSTTAARSASCCCSVRVSATYTPLPIGTNRLRPCAAASSVSNSSTRLSSAARPAAQAEPVALGLHHQPQLRDVDGDHAHALALGPVDGGDRGELRQRFDHVERLFGIGDHPFVAGTRVVGFVEEGQRIEDRRQVRALRGQIAARAHGFTGDRRHQPPPAAARRQARAFGTQRRHDEAQPQVLADRRDLGAQPRLGCHVARRLGVVGVHLEMPGERAQRLLQLFVRGGRHSEAARDQLRRAALGRGKADDRDPLRRILHQRDRAQCIGFPALVGTRVVALLGVRPGTQGRRDAQEIAVALLHRLHLGRALGQVDELLRRVGEHDGGMADQRHDGGRAIEVPLPRRQAVLADGAGHLRVPWGKPLVAADLRKAQRLGFAPPARAALLLERLDRLQRVVLADADRPHDSRRFLAGVARVAGGRVGAQRLQGSEDVAPALPRAGDEEAVRRLLAAQHCRGRIDLPHQPVEPAGLQTFAQRRDQPRRPVNLGVPGATRRVPSERVAPDPRRQQQLPQIVEAAVAVGLRPGLEGRAIECHVAEPGADRMHPTAPSVVRTRIALAGLAETELARLFEMPGRRLREQRHRIEPRHARGEDALARAHLRLPALDGRFERELPIAPAALLREHARAQRVGGSAGQTIERGAGCSRLAAVQEQFTQRQAQRLGHRLAPGIELAQRPFAGRQQLGAPPVVDFRHREEGEIPAPLRRDALEQRGVEGRERRREDDAVPIHRTRDQDAPVIELLRRRSRDQLQPEQRHRRRHVVQRPRIRQPVGRKRIEPMQCGAQRRQRDLVQQLAVQLAAHDLAQPVETVAVRHVLAPALRVQLADRLPDVVLRKRAAVLAPAAEEAEQVVDRRARAKGPQQRHRPRDPAGVGGDRAGWRGAIEKLGQSGWRLRGGDRHFPSASAGVASASTLPLALLRDFAAPVVKSSARSNAASTNASTRANSASERRRAASRER